MLFSSFEFMLGFLPITFVVYFVLSRFKYYKLSVGWLVIASLFFYSWWNVLYLPLILGSMIFNYFIGSLLSRKNEIKINRKHLMILGIVCNIALLGYYKYMGFLLSNINEIISTHIQIAKIILPLGISFFTFTQIAYLVDAYKNETKEYNFFNYALFVTFFPHLLAGPILHHKEMMPQFEDAENKQINYKNIAMGSVIFIIGLFKKIVLADTFSKWVSEGYDKLQTPSFTEAWTSALSYTFQLYFDFSGYCDMAIGAALLFNIVLPINFNSPYLALNIQDFWKKWHITLSRFLTQYLYIPLGGNRKGAVRTYINILIVFIISGLWHGAGWTFVFWGFLHGFASVINRLWQKLNIKMPKFIAWFITFNFVNIAWVFFRAKDWTSALKMLNALIHIDHLSVPSFFMSDKTVLITILLFVMILGKSTLKLMKEFKFDWKQAVYISFVAFISIIIMYASQHSEFLYFNF